MTLGNTVVFLKADMLPETLGEIDAKIHRNTLGDVDTQFMQELGHWSIRGLTPYKKQSRTPFRLFGMKKPKHWSTRWLTLYHRQRSITNATPQEMWGPRH